METVELMPLSTEEADDFVKRLEARVREFGVNAVIDDLIYICDVIDWENDCDGGWSYAADQLASAADAIEEYDDTLAGLPKKNSCEEFDSVALLHPTEDSCND